MPRMPDDLAARYGAILEEYDASIKLLNESKADTLADLRGELKALGYQGAEIGAEVAMLKAAVKELGMTQVERQKADDKDEGVSDYVTILSLARARAHEGDDHDAETGEIIETQPSGNPGEFNPAPLTSNSQAERRLESTEQSAGANADEAVPSALSAPIQPATAAQTGSDVLSDRTPAEQVQVGPDPSLVEREAVESSAKDPGVDSLDVNEGGDHATSDGNAVASHRPLMQGGAVVARLAHNQEADGANPSPATNSLGSAADKPGSGGVSPALPAPRTHNPETHFLNDKGLARLHGCQNPDMCGSSQPRAKLCFSCSVAHDGPAHQPADDEGKVVH